VCSRFAARLIRHISSICAPSHNDLRACSLLRRAMSTAEQRDGQGDECARQQRGCGQSASCSEVVVHRQVVLWTNSASALRAPLPP
jgi:hypothetical protein